MDYIYVMKDLSKKIAIVGNPNVGKSAIFNILTGSYAVVSNYPGTTVEVTRGKVKIHSQEYEVIDTPGMYSFIPITEEEQVSRTILLDEKPDIVLHVIDAKNLERMLPASLQLIEAGLPVILVLNIMDEAEKLGIELDIKGLENQLQIPVIPTISFTGQGIPLLKRTIMFYTHRPSFEFHYDSFLENNIIKLMNELKNSYSISKRSIALLLLQEDRDMEHQVKENRIDIIKEIINQSKKNYAYSLNYIIALRRQNMASQICNKVYKKQKTSKSTFTEKMSQFMMNPWTGIPILLFVLYFGLYQFVGVFAAGTVVNFIESVIFKQGINPYIIKIVQHFIPWSIIQDLFVGEFGIITLGIRYAVAIILPIVSMFFLVFAIIEDTGYLPRLAMLIDRVFKKIGLSGRAVIPIVLGVGCSTMATMVTRTLTTLREKVLATILLALTIPCSAQLGVIMALFAHNKMGLFIWAGIISLVFIFTGLIASKILPGEKPIFFMEVPPLRLPKITNILIKTYSRMVWYFKEIFPLFIYASIFIWVGQITKIFDMVVKLLSYPVQWIGLPRETAVAYLFGFFRRDYGAAGLYDLSKNGILNGNQLVISVVTMTLFLPCIAQLLMVIKERGFKTGISISTFVLFFAFGMGFLLNLVFKLLGVNL